MSRKKEAFVSNAEMKISLNEDAFYYKCGLAIGVPVLLMSLYCCKELLSAYIAYVVIGIPVILIMKVLFSRWLLKEKHYMAVKHDSVTVHHGYRFDNANVSYHNLADAKVIYRRIPCLEAIIFDDSHPAVLYKHMFSSGEYQALLDRMKKHTKKTEEKG